MKILFIGCVESSYILLNELIDYGAEICGVITKKESQFNSDFMDLKPLCEPNNIDYVYSKNSKEVETINFIKNKNPDIIYCFGWSHILNKEIIKIPKIGVVGFHPTKLPQNKGRHPIIWSLVLGLKLTASTFFMIDEKIDNGDIISQIDVDIDFEDDAKTLYKKIMSNAKIQVRQITKEFLEKTIRYKKQNKRYENVWRKRTFQDGKIDFRMSSEAIYNLVRGLTKPYVGAHIEFKNKHYKVWKVEIIDNNNNLTTNIEPGKVVKSIGKNAFLVKTGDGLIKIIHADEINLCEGDYL